MFGIGTTEVLLILVVALLVIGPSKLPEVARALGKGMAEFRKMSSDVKRTIDMESQFSDDDKSPSKEDGQTGKQAVDEIPKKTEGVSESPEFQSDLTSGPEENHYKETSQASGKDTDQSESKKSL
jgi:sec-independent protein translocase protein TatB